MESPVVVDKPPEYHGNGNPARNNERGFPFDEEEGSGAWSELAARHPDIAARLRQRPATWARKRRPSSQDHTDDFGDDFGGFDGFPFDDIPPEFRGHFPSRWNRRFSSRDESEPHPHSQPQTQTSPKPPSPQHQTSSTQTEQNPGPSHDHTYLPQYGLRNTVDLGQKSPADPSLVDAEERGQRSMSAPPDNRANQNPSKMSDQNHHEQHTETSNVRHIPIFVEGRDEPVINKNVDHGEPKQAYVPPPPQQPHPHPHPHPHQHQHQHQHPHPHPHVDREQYFADDGPVGFHAPPNFSRAFGTPFNTFRQGPQPFAQQKVYPQTAFARGASPQRSQSPKPNFPEEKFVKVPVHHEFSKGPPSKPQGPPRAPPPAARQPTPPRPEPAQDPPAAPAPPHKPQPAANDPITQILSIQTDVLNLMTDVENFTGTKKDKKYIYLDEMLTRNLIKLDNIETEGKENIRQARKEAIKCIQKCIAVLEAKADNKNLSTPQPQEAASDVDMKENSEDTNEAAAAPATENGEVEMKEPTKEEEKSEPQDEQQNEQPKAEEKNAEPMPENKETVEPQAVDTRPEEDKATEEVKTVEQNATEDTKKVKAKNAKKRDKSKDKKSVDSNKEQDKAEVMQVDDKGDKTDSQTMEVDSTSQ